jgi:hypothetical protein
MHCGLSNARDINRTRREVVYVLLRVELHRVSIVPYLESQLDLAHI